MREGLLIDYRIRIHAVPVRWRTRIARWDPPFSFVDEQVRGPYSRWRHLHAFEEHAGGVLCLDRVDYRPRGGPLAPVVHALFVERDLRRIFAYRRGVMKRLFGG
jgi:ligand-binding SRPBCC domain-containing protein